MRYVVLALALACSLVAAPAAADTLERIRASGEIRLGHRTDAVPLSYVIGDNQPAGYSVTVCKELAGRLAGALGLEKLAPVWVPVSAQDRFDAVAEGRVDLHCGAATITLSRRERVDFSIPTFIDGTAVLFPRGQDSEFQGLGGKRLGVRRGTTTEQILRNSLAGMGVQAEVVLFDTLQEGVKALSEENIDAFFGDQSLLFGLIISGDLPEGFGISQNILTVEKHGLAMQRGDTEFRLAVDRALSAMYREGDMARIFNATMPGVEPGVALQMLFRLAPELQ